MTICPFQCDNLGPMKKYILLFFAITIMPLFAHSQAATPVSTSTQPEARADTSLQLSAGVSVTPIAAEPTVEGIEESSPGGAGSAANSSTYEITVYDKTLSSSSRVIITQKEIRQATQNSITQMIAQKAGLNVINGSTNPQSYYLRGGDASHILILVDDMPVYDALSTSRSFQMDSLNRASIQQIEVIKGSQTAVYGGQALVAVIKITTINGNLEKTKSIVKLGVGNYVTATADMDHQGVAGKNTYQISAAAGTKDAQSPIRDSSTTYPQSKKSYDVGLLNKSEIGQTLVKYRHFDDDRHIVSRTLDANDNISRNNYDLLGIKFNPDTPYLPQIFYSIVKSERLYNHPVNDLNTLEIDLRYYGDLQTFNFEKTFKFEKFSLLLGHQQTYEAGEINNVKGQNPALNGRKVSESSRLLGTYFLVKNDLTSNTDLTGGYRYNDFNDSQQNEQFQVGFRYKKFKLEYAEGFKTPTLFNLYDINYGNINLQSEKAQSASADYEIQDQQNFYNISLYYVNFSNLITAARNSLGQIQYQNISKAEVSGVDLGYSRTLTSADLGFNVTYQQPIDKITHNWLERRPFFIGSAYYNHKWSDQVNTNFDLVMNSERKDLKTLSEFWIYNASLLYKLDSQNSLYFKVLNVFDKRYEESADYLAEGRLLNVEYEARF